MVLAPADILEAVEVRRVQVEVPAPSGSLGSLRAGVSPPLGDLVEPMLGERCLRHWPTDPGNV